MVTPFDFKFHWWTWDCHLGFTKVFYDGWQCSINIGFCAVTWVYL